LLEDCKTDVFTCTAERPFDNVRQALEDCQTLLLEIVREALEHYAYQIGRGDRRADLSDTPQPPYGRGVLEGSCALVRLYIDSTLGCGFY